MPPGGVDGQPSLAGTVGWGTQRSECCQRALGRKTEESVRKKESPIQIICKEQELRAKVEETPRSCEEEESAEDKGSLGRGLTRQALRPVRGEGGQWEARKERLCKYLEIDQ